MPWSPNFRELRDARLDLYRDQCATLTRGGVSVGYLLVLTGHAANRLGGHLWWRRWELDLEYLHPHVQLHDGSIDDQPLTGTNLDAELEHWGRGEFPFIGELLNIEWMSQEEAVRIAPGVFHVSYCFDNAGGVIWSWAL